MHHLWEPETWEHQSLQLLQQVRTRLWPSLHICEQLSWLQEPQVLPPIFAPIHCVHDLSRVALCWWSYLPLQYNCSSWAEAGSHSGNHRHLSSVCGVPPCTYRSTLAVLPDQEDLQTYSHSRSQLRRWSYEHPFRKSDGCRHPVWPWWLSNDNPIQTICRLVQSQADIRLQAPNSRVLVWWALWGLLGGQVRTWEPGLQPSTSGWRVERWCRDYAAAELWRPDHTTIFTFIISGA